MEVKSLQQHKQDLGDQGPHAIAWRGTIKKIWETKSGKRDGKSWSLVPGVLEDATGEIAVVFANPPARLDEEWEGSSITISARESRKADDNGRLVGAGIKWNSYTSKDGEPIKKAQIKVTMVSDCVVIPGWAGSSGGAPAPASEPTASPPPSQATLGKLTEAEYIGTMLSVFDSIYHHLSKAGINAASESSILEAAERLTATAMIGLAKWTPDVHEQLRREAKETTAQGHDHALAPAEPQDIQHRLDAEEQRLPEDDDIPF